MHTHRQTQGTHTYTHTGTKKSNPSAKCAVTAGKLAGRKGKRGAQTKNGFIGLLSHRGHVHTHTLHTHTEKSGNWLIGAN